MLVFYRYYSYGYMYLIKIGYLMLIAVYIALCILIIMGVAIDSIERRRRGSAWPGTRTHKVLY